MKKNKLGLIYYNDQNWIGGSYYFLNLISAFNTLPKEKQPNIILLSWEKDDLDKFKTTSYPHLSHSDYNIAYTLNYIERKLFAAWPGLVRLYKRRTSRYFASNFVDAVFPYDFNIKLKNIKTKLFWIPDFQDYYLPEFFSEEELITRKEHHQKIASEKNAILILSSKSAEKDFNKFYPLAKCKTKVLNFAVTQPSYSHLDFNVLTNKFNLRSKYFIVPNQFWAHKNHWVVLRSLLILRNKYPDVLVVFTGKEFDYRNPDYTTMLKQFVTQNDLEANVRFLGFINRDEQLMLIKNSMAVIQPSLFEGWSTVIEDAKAIGKLAVASKLSVHLEQLGDTGIYFDPNDEIELTDALEKVILGNFHFNAMDYSKNIERFANEFIAILVRNK